MNTTVHPFERAGLGKAPYKCVGCRENWFEMSGFGRKPGGSCNYCGTGILYEYIVRGSDGTEFVVGCDCVAKTNARVEGFREERLSQARKRRATKTSERRSIRIAEWEKIREAEKLERKNSFYSLRPELVSKLEAYTGANSFILSMKDNLKAYGSLTERMVEAVNRSLNDEERSEALKEISQYVGTVGKRTKNVKLRCTGAFKVGESYFGGRTIPKVLVKLETEDGSQLSWFTSQYFDSSEEFFLSSFSVKEHSEYRGIKQTIVSRVTTE